MGIDLSPIDLSDPADARWLLACVWPDTGRAERVEASIRLAQQDLPTVVAGRANAVLPSILAGLPAGATAIVTTTWAFGYFSVEERAEFVDLLRAESGRRPVAWVSAEGAGTVDALAAVGAVTRPVRTSWVPCCSTEASARPTSSPTCIRTATGSTGVRLPDRMVVSYPWPAPVATAMRPSPRGWSRRSTDLPGSNR